MFDKFNNVARRAILAAQEEARRHHHQLIDTDHLLVALLAADSTVSTVLTEAGLTTDLVRYRLLVNKPALPATAGTNAAPTLSQETNEALTDAFRETLALDHGVIGPEHLLLGLLNGGSSAAVRLLRDLGIPVEVLRRQMLAHLQDVSFSMFLTESVRVGEKAADEARQHRREIVDGVHILLALTAEPDGPVAQVFREFGITETEARQHLHRMAPPALAPPPDSVDFSDLHWQVFDDSMHQARDLGHTRAGSPHLLLALLRADTVGTPQLLRAFGVEAAQLEARLREILGVGAASGTPALTAGAHSEPGSSTDADGPVPSDGLARSRRVLVICGDDQARDAVRTFLRALDLWPVEPEEIVRAAASGMAPYVGQTVRAAFDIVQAVVAVLTPDDVVHRHSDLGRHVDSIHGGRRIGQPDPDVLFETGMAFALHPERTVIVGIGAFRAPSSLTGRDVIRVDGRPEQLKSLAERLRGAGCTVNESGGDWLRLDRFTGLAALTRRPVVPGG